MISREQVEHIAGLARLELSEKEIEKMQKDLAEILGYIDMLGEVDINNIEPTSHSLPLHNMMRGDVVEQQTPETVEAMLNQAPQKEGNYIKVKEVLS
ncbi:MAG: Asp-tRNA(Asn)/Glu-tRNA(Gln) amidotransferase subunit GatC [Candidatus Pacebacteria bacterium]|nr:Asp-tRNA(Asn)/Glu-tRNA(Gln) amidotransferase subunit GatC [Candidatus Paceibacterota bacterium]